MMVIRTTSWEHDTMFVSSLQSNCFADSTPPTASIILKYVEAEHSTIIVWKAMA